MENKNFSIIIENYDKKNQNENDENNKKDTIINYKNNLSSTLTSKSITTSAKTSSLSSKNIDCLVSTIEQYRKKFLHIFKRYLWFSPLIMGISVPLFFFILLINKICNENLHPILPLISDMVVKPPIAGYFSQYCDLMAILNFIIIWGRNKQINYYIKNYFINNDDIINKNKLKIYNHYSIIFGFLFSFGLMILGNFRNSEQPIEHGIGFILSALNLCNMFCMIKICNILNSVKCLETRPTSMTYNFYFALMFLILNIFFGTTAVLHLESIGKWFDNEQRMHWNPKQPGYIFFIICTFSEWFLVLTLSFHYFCLSKRIRLFKIWNEI